MEEFAVNELQAYGIAVDDTLLTYSGRPIRVSNGIIAFLKQRYGVKQSFSIFRRLIGVVLEDDYRGEVLDRNAFRRKVRVLLEKYEKLDLNKDDSSAFLAEEFVHDFQFMDKAVKEADKRKNLRGDKGSSNNFAYTKPPPLGNGNAVSQILPVEQTTASEAAIVPSEGPSGKRRKGKKRAVFERRPRTASVRRVRRLRNSELTKRTLTTKNQQRVEEQEPRSMTDDNKLLSLSEGGPCTQEAKLSGDNVKMSPPQDEDEPLLKIVEHDDAQAPTSASGNGKWIQKSLRAALRREKFAKKRIQVLSYKLRDEKLSLQEALRKLKQLERTNVVRLDGANEAKGTDWKLKSLITSKELESVRMELDKLHEMNRVLAERCQRFENNKVALKSNGKFIEDLRPCLKHLINVGVPADKCGEVLVIVGALLGKTLVSDSCGSSVQCSSVLTDVLN